MPAVGGAANDGAELHAMPIRLPLLAHHRIPSPDYSLVDDPADPASCPCPDPSGGAQGRDEPLHAVAAAAVQQVPCPAPDTLSVVLHRCVLRRPRREESPKGAAGAPTPRRRACPSLLPAEKAQRSLAMAGGVP